MNRRVRGVLSCLAVVGLLAGCESADDVSAPDTAQPTLEEMLANKQLPPGVDVEGLLARGMNFSVAAPLAASPPPVWESDFGTPLGQGDDDCDFLPLGFTFEFYGAAYTGVWVNSNGNVTFDVCNWRFYPTTIPDDDYVIVGALYGDFNPTAGGDVYFTTVGTAPNRRFIVTWSEVPEFFDVGSNTFQVQLIEGTNAVVLGYNGLTTDGLNYDEAYPMNVGISSSPTSFINSASGTDIPALDGTNICYIPSGDGYTELRGPCTIQVAVDIKPGSDPNAINRKSKGVIPVAILGSESFDVLDVDVGSLAFGPGAAAPAHKAGGHYEDVNADGFLDLVSHYHTQDVALAADAVEACVTGQTTAGTPLEGCDAVRVVK